MPLVKIVESEVCFREYSGALVTTNIPTSPKTETNTNIQRVSPIGRFQDYTSVITYALKAEMDKNPEKMKNSEVHSFKD